MAYVKILTTFARQYAPPDESLEQVRTRSLVLVKISS